MNGTAIAIIVGLSIAIVAIIIKDVINMVKIARLEKDCYRMGTMGTALIEKLNDDGFDVNFTELEEGDEGYRSDRDKGVVMVQFKRLYSEAAVTCINDDDSSTNTCKNHIGYRVI